MIIIFYTYLIPRFNWGRERRGFNHFLDSLALHSGYYADALTTRKR